MGTGHVMRCLALAQAWQDKGGHTTLAATTLPPSLGQRLASEGLTLVMLTAEPGSLDDAQQTVEHARALDAPWVVVDGYQFGADYQRALKDANLRVLFMDDYGHAGTYCADIVLNQNSYAHEGFYTQRASHTKLLLGPQYVLLRREFWPWRGWRRETPEVARKVLVTMGGADPDNVTLRVIEALQQIDAPNLEVTIVIGGSNPHYARIETDARAVRHQIRVEQNISDMPALMAWADVAVSAGGSTCYELAFMGIPALIVVLAENQQMGAAALAKAGTGQNLGWYNEVGSSAITSALMRLLTEPEFRAAMSRCGSSLVDSYGSTRIVAEMQKTPLRLRRATSENCRLLWGWANDPAVRKASFSSEPIPWDSHVAWFAAHLASPNYHIFIGIDPSDQPIGQVRFAVEGDTAVISVSLDAGSRNKGYSSKLIRLGTKAIFEDTSVVQINAYVKPENTSSLCAFTHADFAKVGTVVMGETQALQLVLLCKERTL